MRLVAYSRLNEYVEELNRRNGYSITTRQLAEAVQIRRATLIEWLNPDRELSRIETPVMEKLAKYFDEKLHGDFELTKNPERLIRYAWLENEGTGEDPESKAYQTPFAVPA